MKVAQLLIQTFQNVQARSPLLCEQTEEQPCSPCPCFKVVFVCVDRRPPEFDSKLGFQCPQQRGAAPPKRPPITGDSRGASCRHATVQSCIQQQAKQHRKAHARCPPRLSECGKPGMKIKAGGDQGDRYERRRSKTACNFWECQQSRSETRQQLRTFREDKRLTVIQAAADAVVPIR